MDKLNLVSWLISAGNVSSAVLTGPGMMLVLRARRITEPRKVLRVTLIGWGVLFAAQALFWWFGYKSGYPGFKYVQPWMILVAAVNVASSMHLILGSGHRSWGFSGLLTRVHDREGQLR